jgi:hypothetical protein
MKPCEKSAFLAKITLFTFICIPFFSKATTTYTIGASGADYTTIAAAYAACTGSTDYLLEINSNYSYSAESAAGANPISLGLLANKSAVNTVTIRPASGVTLSFSGTASTLFNLNGSNWVYFDGRAAGIGADAWTLINTSSSASKRVFTFLNDASNNRISYCTIKGDNSSTTSGTAGLVLFSTTTASTGNDSNTIEYCTFRENSALPSCFIHSKGTASKTNSDNTVANCNFINAKAYSFWLDTYTDTWSIRDNHFYQSSSISPSTAFYMLNISTGGGYSITGNYFGGRAVNCGGTAFVISSTSNQISIIQFGTACSGAANTVSNNTFSNFTFTTTYTSGTKVSAITTQGSSNFTIGSTGQGNNFGATSGTGNITITDNSSSGTRTLALINLASTGASNSVAYNTAGAFSIGGTNSTGTITMIRNVGANAGITVDNNTFGNTTANNMSFTASHINDWITNNGGSGTYTMTITNNTFQNFSLTSTASKNFYGIYNNIGTVTLLATGNTLKNISATTVGYYYFIAHGNWITTHSAAGEISNNTLQDISVSGTSSTNRQFVLLSNTNGSSTFDSNTIGSVTADNMNFKANTYCYPIYKDGTGSGSITSNTIQQFNIPNTGSSSNFFGINIDDGTATITENSVRNITSTSRSSFPIVGINISGSSSGHVVSKNTISLLSATTVANVTSYLQGIAIGSSSGTGTLSKNRILSLTNTKTGSSGNIAGIYTFSNSSSWNYYNNVIVLNNGTHTNEIDIIGIGHTSTGTAKILHNTVTIGGSTVTSTSSYAFYDFPSTGTRTVFNNVFQNTRTGSGDNHAMLVKNAGSYTYNYNYLEVVDDPNKLVWIQTGAGDRTFAQWQTSSGYYDNKEGSITINSSTGVVSNPTTSDVMTTGANDYSGNVSDDFDGNFRSNAGDGAPNGPWMGAFESIVALPIELLSFTATPAGQKVILEWSTASEVHNAYYTVEKTTDGKNFQLVGKLKGAGTKVTMSTYTLEDHHPLQGVSYYRLTQTDYDGKSVASDLVSVNFSSLKNDPDFTVYPNPLINNQFLSLYFSNQKGKQMVIHDLSGKIVFEQNLDNDSSQQVILGQTLTPGTYLVTIHFESSSKSKMLVIQ